MVAAHEYPYIHLDTDLYADGDPNDDANRYTDTDGHPNANGHIHGDTDADNDTNGHTDADDDANGDTDADGHPDPHGDGNTHSPADGDAYSRNTDAAFSLTCHRPGPPNGPVAKIPKETRWKPYRS